jgi:hypothetical protein
MHNVVIFWIYLLKSLNSWTRRLVTGLIMTIMRILSQRGARNVARRVHQQGAHPLPWVARNPLRR